MEPTRWDGSRQGSGQGEAGHGADEVGRQQRRQRPPAVQAAVRARLGGWEAGRLILPWLIPFRTPTHLAARGLAVAGVAPNPARAHALHAAAGEEGALGVDAAAAAASGARTAEWQVPWPGLGAAHARAACRAHQVPFCPALGRAQ